MKTSLFFLLSFLLFTSSFSQTSRNAISGRVVPPLTKEKLARAVTVRDLIPNCPPHWQEVLSIEKISVIAMQNGEEILAESKHEDLTHQQKQLLLSVDNGMEVEINIQFKWKDNTTAHADFGKSQQMNEFFIAIVPEKEAEFKGGPEQLKNYLTENVYNPLRSKAKVSRKWLAVTATFVVDEQGKVIDAKLSKPSGNPETDQLLLDAINNMPAWEPARDANGVQVKQKFTLTS
jgi:TonB family protein